MGYTIKEGYFFIKPGLYLKLYEFYFNELNDCQFAKWVTKTLYLQSKVSLVMVFVKHINS